MLVNRPISCIGLITVQQPLIAMPSSASILLNQAEEAFRGGQYSVIRECARHFGVDHSTLGSAAASAKTTTRNCPTMTAAINRPRTQYRTMDS